MLEHYAFFPTSPWWLTLFPSKWFSLGMGLLLGTPLKSHRTLPNHTYDFQSLFPSISLSLGILKCIDLRRGCPSFYGKKGLKAQRGRCWVKIKALFKPSRCFTKGSSKKSMKGLSLSKGDHTIIKNA
jgi:hypothetical protein